MSWGLILCMIKTLPHFSAFREIRGINSVVRRTVQAAIVVRVTLESSKTWVPPSCALLHNICEGIERVNRIVAEACNKLSQRPLYTTEYAVVYRGPNKRT